MDKPSDVLLVLVWGTVVVQPLDGDEVLLDGVIDALLLDWSGGVVCQAFHRAQMPHAIEVAIDVKVATRAGEGECAYGKNVIYGLFHFQIVFFKESFIG